MDKLKKLLDKIDVSRHVSNRLVGKHHTHFHRKVTGVAIMSVGVMLVHLSMMSESLFVHLFADIIGYGIHGIGLIPFAQHFESKKQDCVGDHCAV